jgi:hypothetical protein
MSDKTGRISSKTFPSGLGSWADRNEPCRHRLLCFRSTPNCGLAAAPRAKLAQAIHKKWIAYIKKMQQG